MRVESDLISDFVLDNIAYLKSELIFMGIQKLNCDVFSKKKVLTEVLRLLDSFFYLWCFLDDIVASATLMVLSSFFSFGFNGYRPVIINPKMMKIIIIFFKIYSPFYFVVLYSFFKKKF